MTAYVTDVCERCGNLRSVCSDPEAIWYPQRAVCYATAAAAQTHRETAKRFGHPEPDDPSPHESDGLEWWASPHDLTPEDDFFGTQSLLGAATANQPVGEQDNPQDGGPDSHPEHV